MGAPLYCKSCGCRWYNAGPCDPDCAECPDCGGEDSRFDVPLRTRVRWWFVRVHKKIMDRASLPQRVAALEKVAHEPVDFSDIYHRLDKIDGGNVTR